MHAIAIALIASLTLGPATAEPGTDAPDVDTTAEAEPESEAEAAPGETLPDVTDEPAADSDPEVAADDEAPDDSEPAPDAADDEASSEEPPAPSVEPEPEPEPVPVTRDRLGCDGSKSCRRMTVAGIVVGSLGLVGVGVGIGLLVNDDRVVPEQPIYVNSTHPPGLVAVTICSGLALTSVLMLVAAHKGYKEDDRSASRTRVRVSAGGLRF